MNEGVSLQLHQPLPLHYMAIPHSHTVRQTLWCISAVAIGIPGALALVAVFF
jgi:hypothetical protein